MSEHLYERIGDVIADPLFPELDLALRRGRHIDLEDVGLFSLLEGARPLLVAFYDRFGCELVYTPDQVVYLLPRGDQLGRRRLRREEMLVGQALALLFLDPSTVATRGRVPQSRVLEVLINLLGQEGTTVALAGKRRRRHETADARKVQERLRSALLGLSRLGFIELDGETVRLRRALSRFIEPVRGEGDRAAALARLVAGGAVEVDAGGADGQD